MQDLSRWANDSWWGVREAWRVAPAAAALWGALQFASGFVPLGVLLGSRQALRSLETGSTWSDLLPSLALLVGVLAAAPFLASTLKLVRVRLLDLVHERMADLLHTHASRVPYAFFEQPEGHDLLNNVRVHCLQQPFQLLEQASFLLLNSALLLGVLVVLGGYSMLLPLILLASSLPGLWLLGRHAIAYVRHSREVAPLRRRAGHDSWMMTERRFAADIRMYLLTSFLGARYDRNTDDLRGRRRRIEEAGWRTEAVFAAVGIAGVLGGVAVMARARLQGGAMVTDIVIAFQAYLMGQRMMRGLLDNAMSLYRSGAHLEDFRKLRDLPSDPPEPHRPELLPALRLGIAFEGVRYRYPSARRDVIDGLDLFLPAGRITALMGPNGAGKSTLIRLLCGLSTPTEGRILLDGTELSSLPVHRLRASISVLFQKPVAFHATVRENALWGNPGICQDALERAADAAGIRDVVARLPQGWDTLLGPAFGGLDLSGGEWQRLALARAFVRDAPIAVLDEPTSDLDGWSESDWFERFKSWSAGRTTLLITHRFSTAMKADAIHVLDAGRIVEAGSHAELMALGGLYAKGWREQMGS